LDLEPFSRPGRTRKYIIVMTPAPKTLASEINTTAAKLLKAIGDEYLHKIDEHDYNILIQSCTKLMEISAKIRTVELCKK